MLSSQKYLKHLHGNFVYTHYSHSAFHLNFHFESFNYHDCLQADGMEQIISEFRSIVNNKFMAPSKKKCRQEKVVLRFNLLFFKNTFVQTRTIST